eukprot:TRINITY_DN2950_c0_g1_i1.p1 TRINITY_DN2950_c0_g1~~TRINITY_DN2950_c0_g1_i1.p1  ORF type:complete len:375 (-),score=181.60 TRINITY_DN2950_c0_g1_i1:231-1355(-)
MFNFIKKAATDVAEKATGKDLDGDGDVGEGSIGGKVADFIIPPSKARETKLEDGIDMPLSSCDGNKKSLFIGINYHGQQGELRGCINDVNNIKGWVTENWGFPTDDEHMLVLTDDQEGDKSPTRANIIAGMRWLVEGAKEGDSLFFHYSGHGGSVKDDTGESDEADGMDETFIPLDYKEAGMILDDEVHAILVAPLPEGVRITAITDCCHSGSIFDLPFTYTIDGDLATVHEVDNRMVAIKAALSAGKALFDGDKISAAKHSLSAVKAMYAHSKGQTSQADTSGKPLVVRRSLADVIQFSGCKDEQTSADAHIEGEHTGAMSWAFMEAFEQHGKELTYTQLLGHIRQLLQTKYTQVPQMSTGHKCRMDSAVFKM